MPERVSVVGVGMTAFGRFASTPIEVLARQAAVRAIEDSGLDRSAIDEVFCGTSYAGPLMGQRAARELGITGLPITNVENACSSGATALREAITAIQAGRVNTALVIGVDQLTQFKGGAIPLDQADVEASQGMAMPALYAMRARRYLAQTEATESDLAQVAVKAHEFGSRNQYAQFQNIVDETEVLSSRMIASPLTLFMCCPTGDGAAAAILTRRQIGDGNISVLASTLRSGHALTGPREMASSELVTRTAAAAYEEAGVGPEDISLVELHDAFAIAEIMYYEALGLCPPGEGAAFLRGGATSLGGSLPVNPSGGLLCRGHPVGATGVAQICEAVWQLRGQAGQRQATNEPRVALTQCTGGGIAGFDHGACTIHILARD
jgi:benzoylsuccinyl-CoA thiolase BbsB subunit